MFSSPAAQICARYKIAIRRPKPGSKVSYARHLAKYGLGVAAAGTAILVLWEMTAPNGSSFFRAVRPGWGGSNNGWHGYQETQTIFMGEMICLEPDPVLGGDQALERDPLDR